MIPDVAGFLVVTVITYLVIQILIGSGNYNRKRKRRK